MNELSNIGEPPGPITGMTAVVGRFIGVAGVAWSSNFSVLVVCELECAL